MNTKWNAFWVILFAVTIIAFSHTGYAREGVAAGVFLDLPGSMSDSGVLPSTRLILGDGITVAHLDILFGLATPAIPNPGLRFLPYLVLNFPIKFSSAVLTPYTGFAPILFTAGALATPPLADMIFKFGASFTFSGFGFYAETGFYVPVAALPTFGVGFMVDFDSLGSLFCDACGGDEYF